MTISVGLVSSGSAGSGGTATTSAGTTIASGSTFYVSATIKNSASVALNISDNKGNTYTQIGTAVGDAASRWLSRYQCVNGTGGAGHTLTATESVGTDGITVFFVEVVGGATVTPLDQSNSFGSSFSGNPVPSGNITVTPAATSELLISTFWTEAFADGLVFTEANGFIVQASVTSGTSLVVGGIGTMIVSSPGTYSASWSNSTGGNSVIAAIDSFQGGSGGGGGGGVQNGAILPSAYGPHPGIMPGGPIFQTRPLSSFLQPTPNVTVSLAGQRVAFIQGALGPTLSPAITGLVATAAVGTVIYSSGVTLGLTGVRANFATGIVSAVAGGDVTVGLTGVAATFTVGLPLSQGFLLPAMDAVLLQSTSAYYK